MRLATDSLRAQAQARVKSSGGQGTQPGAPMVQGTQPGAPMVQGTQPGAPMVAPVGIQVQSSRKRTRVDGTTMASGSTGEEDDGMSMGKGVGVGVDVARRMPGALLRSWVFASASISSSSASQLSDQVDALHGGAMIPFEYTAAAAFTARAWEEAGIVRAGDLRGAFHADAGVLGAGAGLALASLDRPAKL